jgi:hypothetical protein
MTVITTRKEDSSNSELNSQDHKHGPLRCPTLDQACSVSIARCGSG